MDENNYPNKKNCNLKSIAKNLYDRFPYYIKWLFKPFVACYRFYQSIRPGLWIAKGNDKNSGQPLAVLCSLNIGNRNYIFELFFKEIPEQQYLGRFWIWQIPKEIKNIAKDCSVAVIEINNHSLKYLDSNKWFFIPAWVRGQLDFPLPPAAQKQKKEAFRHMKRHSFSYQITQQIEHLDDFYYNMYVPYINEAHQKNAILIQYHEMKRIFKNCELLLLTQHDINIAGLLIAYTKKNPRISYIGIKDANQQYLKAGAIGALYQITFQYLQSKGYSKVGYGLSRAFIKDGVFRFKKIRFMKIVGRSREIFAVKILKDDVTTRGLLQNNPFIFIKNDTLNAAVFIDQDIDIKSEYIKNIKKDSFIDGLSQLVIYNFSDSSSEKTIYTDRSDTVIVGDVAKILISS